MASLWTFILIGSVIYLFWLNRKVAEAANVHAKRQSEQLQVQLMSVACTKRRFGFLKNGKPGIKSEFIFEFSRFMITSASFIEPGIILRLGLWVSIIQS